MKYKKKEVFSAVSMAMFGIKTTVLASHKKLRALRQEMESLPKGFSFGGLGKEKFIQGLNGHLQREDQYFNQNLSEAVKGNPRWDNFCDDCVDLAVLSSVIHKHPVHLIHPDSYMSSVAKSMNAYAPDVTPSLMEDISSVRMDH